MQQADAIAVDVPDFDERIALRPIATKDGHIPPRFIDGNVAGNRSTTARSIVKAELGKKAEVSVIDPSAFGPGDVSSYDAIAFGCPAMGAEVLEEDVFEPMFASVEGSLSGKKIILFGSYGWGDGEWMRNWQERCENAGAVLTHEPVICQEAPDAETEDALKEAAQSLA